MSNTALNIDGWFFSSSFADAEAGCFQWRGINSSKTLACYVNCAGDFLINVFLNVPESKGCERWSYAHHGLLIGRRFFMNSDKSSVVWKEKLVEQTVNLSFSNFRKSFSEDKVLITVYSNSDDRSWYLPKEILEIVTDSSGITVMKDKGYLKGYLIRCTECEALILSSVLKDEDCLVRGAAIP